MYAVNGRQVPASHRAVYIWSEVRLLTSMSGVSVVTKRNLISGAIPFVFIVLQAKVTKPGLVTSEPAEHIFGISRMVVREFTTMDFTQILEKVTRRLKIVFCSGFKPSHDSQKGYGSPFVNFIDLSRDKNHMGTGGASVKIDTEGPPFIEQMWHSVQNVMTYAKNLVEPLLKMLGTVKAEMSHFCWNFESLADLKDEYLKY